MRVIVESHWIYDSFMRGWYEETLTLSKVDYMYLIKFDKCKKEKKKWFDLNTHEFERFIKSFECKSCYGIILWFDHHIWIHLKTLNLTILS